MPCYFANFTVPNFQFNRIKKSSVSTNTTFHTFTMITIIVLTWITCQSMSLQEASKNAHLNGNGGLMLPKIELQFEERSPVLFKESPEDDFVRLSCRISKVLTDDYHFYRYDYGQGKQVVLSNGTYVSQKSDPNQTELPISSNDAGRNNVHSTAATSIISKFQQDNAHHRELLTRLADNIEVFVIWYKNEVIYDPKQDPDNLALAHTFSSSSTDSANAGQAGSPPQHPLRRRVFFLSDTALNDELVFKRVKLRDEAHFRCLVVGVDRTLDPEFKYIRKLLYDIPEDESEDALGTNEGRKHSQYKEEPATQHVSSQLQEGMQQQQQAQNEYLEHVDGKPLILERNFTLDVLPISDFDEEIIYKVPGLYVSHSQAANYNTIGSPKFIDGEIWKQREIVNAAGTRAVIRCPAVGAPKPNITWYKDGEKLAYEPMRIKKKKWVLILDYLVMTDKGNYTCVVQNAFGSINATFLLDVIEVFPHRPLILPGYPQNVTVFLGQTAVLECPLFVDMEVTIHWLKVYHVNGSDTNDEGILYSHVVQTSQDQEDPTKYVIPNVTRRDAGQYYCSATNSIGTTDAHAWVRVIDSPPPPHIKYRIINGTVSKLQLTLLDASNPFSTRNASRYKELMRKSPIPFLSYEWFRIIAYVMALLLITCAIALAIFCRKIRTLKKLKNFNKFLPFIYGHGHHQSSMLRAGGANGSLNNSTAMITQNPFYYHRKVTLEPQDEKDYECPDGIRAPKIKIEYIPNVVEINNPKLKKKFHSKDTTHYYLNTKQESNNSRPKKTVYSMIAPKSFLGAGKKKCKDVLIGSSSVAQQNSAGQQTPNEASATETLLQPSSFNATQTVKKTSRKNTITTSHMWTDYKMLYEEPKWNISRERLTIGKKVGEGAFGCVAEADLQYYDKQQPSISADGTLNSDYLNVSVDDASCATGRSAATTSHDIQISPAQLKTKKVAVKMLKDNASDRELIDLISELEVMKLIGHHVNIINLIGCCSSPEGPLYVVVELAERGNLRDFLRKNRQSCSRAFYDVPFLPTIHQQSGSNTDDTLVNNNDNKTTMTTNPTDPLLPQKNSFTETHLADQATNNSQVASTRTEDKLFLDDQGINPEQRDDKPVNDDVFIKYHYHPKTKSNRSYSNASTHSSEKLLEDTHDQLSNTTATPLLQRQTKIPEANRLTTKDLINFAYQISQGMEYLSSRKCIHRDLAARNILLTADYVIKIADFGLARDLASQDYYKKQTDGRLPVKWMAPESLFYRKYTIKSDVWSFGIVLWEIMTLGGTPYPSIPVEKLFDFLKSNQRLKCPQNCPKEVYNIMLNCWHAIPEKRPSFEDISQALEKLLLNTLNVEYLDLGVSLDTPSICSSTDKHFSFSNGCNSHHIHGPIPPTSHQSSSITANHPAHINARGRKISGGSPGLSSLKNYKTSASLPIYYNVLLSQLKSTDV